MNKKTILVFSTAAFLAACGGNSHTTDNAVVEQAAPATSSPNPDMPGYQQDGTLTPVPTDSTPATTSTTSTVTPKPCKIPQASETGIAHGKPPVGRCDV